MLNTNILTKTDSYKLSHWLQYPPDTEYVYSYIESRGGEFDRTVFFGLQMIIIDNLLKPVTMEDIDEAEEIATLHGEPFNREGWEYIVRVHGGRLPVEIKAVPEGTVMPTRNVLVTIVNTDPKCFWLTSYLETVLMRAWYPITVASLSHECKRIIRSYLDKTCDDPEAEIPFKLHDFGARGVSSGESAAIGGLAHLVNFMGTDTVEALVAGRRYYGEKMAGFSIPAAEHSTITSWVDMDKYADLEEARLEGETAACENMIDTFGKPNALLACVGDSYNIFRTISEIWGKRLKAKVLALGEKGGRLVVRPDSGEPATIVLKCVELLGETFGFKENKKGFKVLHPAVRVIQGDGINVHSIPEILVTLVIAGWSTENVTFGMGGGLLQQVNRDTLKFAMKCSAICVDGVWRDVFKDPVTDPGKGSKKGRLALITEEGYYATVPHEANEWRDALVPVYRNGVLLRKWTFAEVREHANRPMLGEDVRAAA